MALQFEHLESRRCMAAAWQNPVNPLDVDQSSLVTPVDALQVINRLNHSSDGFLGLERPAGLPCYDSNGDGWVSPLDALRVINVLNRYAAPLQLVVNTASGVDPNATGIVLTPNATFVGTTLPGIQITATTESGTDGATRVLGQTESDANGRFQLDLELQKGHSQIDFVARDPRGRAVSVARRMQLGDVVLDWNAAALNVVREWTTTSDDPYRDRIVPSQPPMVAKNLAMIHTAMFDAVNAVEGLYEPYLTGLVADPAASPEAAAAAAAYHVASAIYPDADEMAHWDATLAESLASIPDDSAKTLGIALGKRVAEAMLEARADDGSGDAQNYVPGSEPGDWNRTWPAFLPPQLPQWPAVEPFAIESAAAYRPDPPPPLSSDQYAAAVDQVMQLGRLNSDVRTEDQTQIAIFWADGSGTFTPPGHWNQIAADVALMRERTLLENARLFALLNIAEADAGIAAWDAKYHYGLWRPIEAIRRADVDGNPSTSEDPSWLPLLETPPFPTYTSGHSTFSGAAAAVLTHLLGGAVSFTTTLDGHGAPAQRPLDPDLVVTRSYTSFQEAAEEAGMSRIFGGIHFAFDDAAGLQAGRSIGSYVVDAMLRPSPE